jgi:dTDP-4-dehydrorhamnose reductase
VKILLTGKNGQVGWELARTLAPLGTVVAADRAVMDLRVPDSIRDNIRRVEPDVIVNAAAYTAVDQAEIEPEAAMAVNGTGPGIIAEEAKRIGALLVHYSTDYVFDGKKPEPYTESDVPNPVNVYGKTKLAGEEMIRAARGTYLIFRTSWVYGTRGKNFLLTIERLARERNELEVVDDQIGAPTWCRSIAETTARILLSAFGRSDMPISLAEASGIYHMTAAGATSWCGFARAIVDTLASHVASPLLKLTPASIKPISTEAYPLRAPRPCNSQLSNQRLVDMFGIAIGDWHAELETCLAERSSVTHAARGSATEEATH